MLTIALVVLGLIVGFIVGKFWRSRKIDETVDKAKQMAKNPNSISILSKEIADIWK